MRAGKLLCVMLLAGAALAAPAHAAPQDSLDFVRTHAPISLFGPAEIETERQGGGLHWPWDGVSFGAYTGVFPLFVAFTQGFELAVPIIPALSATARIEGTIGPVFNGFFFEPGLRAHLPISEIFSLNFDAAIHFGGGTYDVGLFDDDEDKGEAAGWGPVVRGGLDIGGRSVRFFTGLAGSFFFFTTEDSRRIGLPYLGLELGIRVYLG